MFYGRSIFYLWPHFLNRVRQLRRRPDSPEQGRFGEETGRAGSAGSDGPQISQLDFTEVEDNDEIDTDFKGYRPAMPEIPKS